MPLSKARNRERMRQLRLHQKVESVVVQPDIPLYNAMVHKAGDTVRVWRGKRLMTVTIPELDADGQPMPFV